MMVVVEKKLVVRNKLGLHARPAALFVQLASRFESDIVVKKGTKQVNGKSIMGILMLAAGKGSRILVSANGRDAQRAVEELERLLSSSLPEE